MGETKWKVSKDVNLRVTTTTVLIVTVERELASAKPITLEIKMENVFQLKKLVVSFQNMCSSNFNLIQWIKNIASSSQSTRSCGRNEVKANGRCEPTCDDLSGDECYDYRDTRSVKNDDFDDYDYYSNNNNNYEEDRGNSDCICRRNYVRDSDGRCVKAEKICSKLKKIK